MERHPIDLLSLFSGLLVTGFAVIALTDAWLLDPAPWLWPAALVATGVVVLAALVASSRAAEPDAVAADGSGDRLDARLRAEARAELDATDPVSAGPTDGAEPTDVG